MINPDTLSFDQLEDYVNQILTGRKLVFVSNSSGEDIPVLFCHLSSFDKLSADLIYRAHYKRALASGILTRFQMEEHIRLRGLFTEEDEAQIASLESKLHAQQEVLKMTTKVPSKRSRLSDIVTKLEGQIRDIKSKRDSKLTMTCESLATEEKFLFILWKSTLLPTDNINYWENVSAFREDSDNLFKSNIITEFIEFFSGINLRVVRYLARNNIWRIRYMIARKTGADLFDIPIKDYSIDMLNILYWSDFYTSVYEMMPDDRPPESVINDDEALDAYMEEYYSEKNREWATSRGSKGFKTSSAYTHDEVIVTKSNPLYQDIEYTKIPKRAENKDRVDMTEKEIRTGKKT